MYQLTGIPDNQLQAVLGDIALDGSRVSSQFRASDGTWTLIIVLGSGSASGHTGSQGGGSQTGSGATDVETEFQSGMLIRGRPSITLQSNGKVAVGQDGLSIEYRGSDSCPYGISASQNARAFVAMVIHHTADDHDTDWYVQYQIDGDSGRDPPGHYGYHFYVAPSGKVIQGAPLTKRTNHVSPSNQVRREFGRIAQNTNAVGICCVGAWNGGDFNPTKKQTREVESMIFALADVYSISFSNVFGHGEIQTNRRKEEGTSIAKAVREW